jgi:hypothetical protein
MSIDSRVCFRSSNIGLMGTEAETAWQQQQQQQQQQQKQKQATARLLKVVSVTGHTCRGLSQEVQRRQPAPRGWQGSRELVVVQKHAAGETQGQIDSAAESLSFSVMAEQGSWGAE